MQFNSFIRAGQDGLIEGFQEFVDQGITELVIDLRYNGGGLVTMASQIAYMIAGSAQTNNQVFQNFKFNDKHLDQDPVTGRTNTPIPFYNQEKDWASNEFTNKVLPSVDLTRVFILVTGNTCSASEAVINGLRGIDLEVVLVGETTCGKPYGFYATDNCSTTYFTVQLQLVNAKEFGEYSDGFRAVDNPLFEDQLPGCTVKDDFSQTLGSKDESLLASAIAYAESGTCPVQNKPVSKPFSKNKENSIDIRKPNIMLDAIILEENLGTALREPRQ
jgi:hypothetical protein